LNEVNFPKRGNKPRIWDSGDEFVHDVVNYINVCETKYNQFPNLAGFCVWMDIHRATFYEQQKLYPDSYKKVQEIFENSALNSRQASDNMKFFYMKNKFNYSDHTTIGLEGPIAVSMSLDKLSDAELKTLKELTAKIEVE
jgi:hypothetical protein